MCIIRNLIFPPSNGEKSMKRTVLRSTLNFWINCNIKGGSNLPAHLKYNFQVIMIVLQLQKLISGFGWPFKKII